MINLNANIDIGLLRTFLLVVECGGFTGETGTIIQRVVPARIRRRGVEMRLILEEAGNNTGAFKPDPTLIKAITRARKWFDALVSGHARSHGEIAKAEGISCRYVGHLLPLAFLAPDIVEAIFAGTQPADLTAQTLIKRTNLPLKWAEQRDLLSFN
ncbi:MAG: hypothetical protein RIB59_01860 [Rhodospirillales bacterium]